MTARQIRSCNQSSMSGISLPGGQRNNTTNRHTAFGPDDPLGNQPPHPFFKWEGFVISRLSSNERFGFKGVSKNSSSFNHVSLSKHDPEKPPSGEQRHIA